MRFLVICSIAVLSLAFAVFGLAAQPAVPGDGLVMKRTGQPVTFNHSTHAKGECVTCHHEVGGAADYRACSTEGCHDVFDRKDKTVHSYYNVLHGKGLAHPTCISCHQQVAGKDREMRRQLTGCKNSACHSTGVDGDEES